MIGSQMMYNEVGSKNTGGCEMNVVINNSEVVRYVGSVAARNGVTGEQLVERLLVKAVKDAQYRARRNAQVWEQTKALRERAAELEAKVRELGLQGAGGGSIITDDELEAMAVEQE